MSASAARAVSSTSDHKIAIVLWWVALTIGVYFVARYVPPYLVWSEVSYGPYFWPRAGYLLPHLVGGLVAIVIGPLQLWPRIRNRYPRFHRISGRVYLGAIVVGSLAGIALALTSGVNAIYATGLLGLAAVWLLTGGMAFAAIRRRNIVQHKQWMIRSYVVTFAFVSFRIIDDTLGYLGIGERADNVAILAWACWAVPLVVTEAAIQGRQIFARPQSLG
jgi:hypothetical protein